MKKNLQKILNNQLVRRKQAKQEKMKKILKKKKIMFIT